ncbi:DNA-binding protein [Aliikangiella marina]|uniref:DNA-binding protein n=1 Tax=Aliikangiella marina TaxID=1712262 RepID=A0A545THK8_9GAMM|nr:excisionase family protein [Aliikangiella marina]TQV76641.1 DNA-binding protein [Aliikangiella marina]
MTEQINAIPGDWVKAKLLTSINGYSPEAARKKRARGEWLEGVHWVKAPDNNYFYNWREIEIWIRQGY